MRGLSNSFLRIPLSETACARCVLQGRSVYSSLPTYRAEAAHGGLDVLDEVGLVRIAALGLGDEEVGRLEAGLEPDISLAAEEGLVPPCLADFHGLMHTFFSGHKGLLGFGAAGKEPGAAGCGGGIHGREAWQYRFGGRRPRHSGGRSGGQHGSDWQFFVSFVPGKLKQFTVSSVRRTLIYLSKSDYQSPICTIDLQQ